MFRHVPPHIAFYMGSGGVELRATLCKYITNCTIILAPHIITFRMIRCGEMDLRVEELWDLVFPKSVAYGSS